MKLIDGYYQVKLRLDQVKTEEVVDWLIASKVIIEKIAGVDGGVNLEELRSRLRSSKSSGYIFELNCASAEVALLAEMKFDTIE